MTSQVLTIEADSVDSAREQARAKVPSSAYLFSEVIFCDGSDQMWKPSPTRSARRLRRRENESHQTQKL